MKKGIRLNVEIGQRFNMLIVIKEMPIYRLPGGQTNRVFRCRCDCGNEKDFKLLHIRHNRVKSCGCMNRRYGGFDGVLSKAWRSMRHRCSKNYFHRHLYYDKGITVCDEWLNSWESFRDWAIENGWKRKLQIDRIDNSKGYSPKNCRIVSNRVNANNRDDTFFITYNGKKEALALLTYKKGLTNHLPAIRARISRGWNPQKAIDTPIRKGKYKKSVQ